VLLEANAALVGIGGRIDEDERPRSKAVAIAVPVVVREKRWAEPTG
jgi:hypothetical protein